MKVLVIGLDHDVQWRDPTGDFRRLLEGRLRGSDIDLVAEEANKLPTTVGQRLACRLNVPWLNMDMDDVERREAGIFDELRNRFSAPLMEDGDPLGSYSGSYLPHADGVREDYWISQVRRHKVGSAIIVCGLMHLAPLAQKLRSHGCVVEELNICELDWYVMTLGTTKIVEDDLGQRRSEFRPPRKPGAATW